MTSKIKTVFLLILTISALTVSNLIISIGSETAQQVVYQATQQETDIIFVIDFSNSMNANDRDKVALQMLGACIDALYTDKVRVGFVAYNDRILSASPPVTIFDQQSRENLKQQINSIGRSGSTDIGLALAAAEDYIRQYSIPEGRRGRIILLSDGEPDLTYSKTGRTTQQSIDQMTEVSQRAAEIGVAIDSIAFGQNYDGETTALAAVSERSGGGMYVARTPEVLIDIFGQIIEQTTFSRLRPISVTIAGGEEQMVELPAKDSFADEANILVVSSKPLQDITILYSGEQVTYSRSNHYFTCKITDLKNEDLMLKMIGSKDQEIRIYLVLYKDFEVYFEADEQADKNIPYHYRYYAKGTDGSVITEERFYEMFQEQIFSAIDDHPAELETRSGESMFERTVTFAQSGEYRLGFTMHNDYFYMDIRDIAVAVKNTPPRGEFETELRYLMSGKQKIFQLDEYFTDDNQDPLTYGIQYLAVSGKDNVSVEGDQLIIDLASRGKTSFMITARDPEGADGDAGVVTISVEPFWIYYSELLIAVFIVCLMISIYFLLLRKKRRGTSVVIAPGQPAPEQTEVNVSFNGKLNAYFTKAPDGMEIEPLTFALYQLKEKKVTLGHLLECLEIPFVDFDPDQIFLQGGPNREMVISHHSNCSIMIGSSIICRKLNYSVEYGNKIYISSEHGDYELELHYLSIRS